MSPSDAISASLADKAAALKGKAPKKRKSTWKQPSLEDVAEGAVLAFDQTFSKTGWVLVSYHGADLNVIDHGFIQEPPIPDSPRFWDVLQRTEWMGDRISLVVGNTYAEWGDAFDVVHEQPILQGMRVESSLLGAVKVWEACKFHDLPTPTIISKTRVAGLLMPPDDRQGKPAVTRALSHFVDTSKGWNEHNRDALALAITHLIDKKKAEA